MVISHGSPCAVSKSPLRWGGSQFFAEESSSTEKGFLRNEPDCVPKQESHRVHQKKGFLVGERLIGKLAMNWLSQPVLIDSGKKPL